VADPVQLSCEHFLTAVRSSSDDSPARGSARVVEVLDALQRSLPQGDAVARASSARSRNLRLVEVPAAAP
jgi:hypothetical protein